MSQLVLTHTDQHGNATVILNRPDARNALNSEMVLALTAALRAFERDPAVRAIVLMGQGENFCAGADVVDLPRNARQSAAAYEKLAKQTAQMLQTLHDLKKPTVACVRGAAHGDGIGLACACDITLADRHATFRFPEAKAGLVPAVVSPYALSAIGERMARRYLLTGEEFDAAEAYRIGLIHDLLEADGLIPAVGTLLGHLYTSGPRALARIKALIPAVAREATGAAATRQTLRHIAGVWKSAEAQEGIAALLDQRAPVWADPAAASAPRGARKRSARRR